MRAALHVEKGKPVQWVDDVEIRGPRAGEVLVRVHACGLCHSDVTVMDLGASTPVVLGHEAAGVVEAVGAGVATHKPGDKVVLTPCPPCGTCYWCVRGEFSVCKLALGVMTGAFPDGSTGLTRKGEKVWRGLNVAAFAEYTVTQAQGAVVVPQDTPLDVACVVGCAVQTGVGAVLNAARVEEGASVFVTGLGGIGADYAFEAAGVAALVTQCFFAARMGGKIIVVGAPPIDQAVTLAPAALVASMGKTLRGTLLGDCNSVRDIPRFLALWRAGRLDLDALITGRRPLSEINEAVADLRATRGVRTVLAV